MAYENGYEVTSYIGVVIEKYRADPLVFTKALQLVPVFMARPDWPHSFDMLDVAVDHILGQRLTDLTFGFTQRYLDDERMEWPDNLPAGFKDSLRAFHLAVSSIANQFWSHARSQPMRVFSVACARHDNMSLVKFIRADGQSLEMFMDQHDIEAVINALRPPSREDADHGG